MFLPICISCNVFVYALDADFYSCAAIAKHLAEVWLQAVIRSRLNGDSDAFCSVRKYDEKVEFYLLYYGIFIFTNWFQDGLLALLAKRNSFRNR